MMQDSTRTGAQILCISSAQWPDEIPLLPKRPVGRFAWSIVNERSGCRLSGRARLSVRCGLVLVELRRQGSFAPGCALTIEGGARLFALVELDGLHASARSALRRALAAIWKRTKPTPELFDWVGVAEELRGDSEGAARSGVNLGPIHRSILERVAKAPLGSAHEATFRSEGMMVPVTELVESGALELLTGGHLLTTQQLEQALSVVAENTVNEESDRAALLTRVAQRLEVSKGVARALLGVHLARQASDRYDDYDEDDELGDG